MKVLIITNGNIGRLPAFVSDQLDVLREYNNCKIRVFYRTGHGIVGYLKNLSRFKKEIIDFCPDVIHAHYGLTGLLANLQRKVPVVTTYHGSDIHSKGFLLYLSRISMKLSAHNIFVSKKLLKISNYKRSNSSIIPCGVDLNLFQMVDKIKARKELGWKQDNQYILFAKSFDNKIKNYPLAKVAVEKLNNVVLVEFKGFTRDKVYLPINASDCLLMTSLREGSPGVVKEALACGTPVVSVDCGDVREIIGNTNGCYVTGYDANEIAEKLKLALEFKGKTSGRQRIIDLELSNDIIAERLISIYEEVIQNNKKR